MNEFIIQLVAACFGSVGFAVILKMKRNLLVYAGLGGTVTWGIYLVVYAFLPSLFIANFAASIFVGLYAEIMARFHKIPTTVFLTSASIPLIPGGRLYYTMAGLVASDETMFAENGKATIIIVLGIVVGLVVTAIFTKYFYRILNGKGKS
ncbi:MAG: threonine/serine exporter family protein [Emergencia sp.]